MSGVCGVCEGCLAVLVVWCVSPAGPPKSKVATSLAYTKNRLKPNLPSRHGPLSSKFPRVGKQTLSGLLWELGVLGEERACLGRP